MPSLHRAYIAAMISMFGDCTLHATRVTNIRFDFFLLASSILLVAVMGAIVLTMHKSVGTKLAMW